MQTLVVFDIGSNKLRAKVENACRDYGLERAQFSAFIGDLSPQRRANLAVRFLTLITEHRTREKEDEKQQALIIHMYPICSADFESAIGVDRQGFQQVQAKEKPHVLVL